MKSQRFAAAGFLAGAAKGFVHPVRTFRVNEDDGIAS